MFTFGADPEYFIRDNSNGNFVPSIGMIGGTKNNPREVKNGAVQEDNVTAEININPTASASEFVRNIKEVTEQLQEIIGPDYSLVATPTAEFEPEQLAHPQARVSGCDPDYNVYTNSQNEYPPFIGDPIRHAGGHIHIGWENPNPIAMSHMVYLMDAMVGLPLLLIDNDRERIKKYGRIGNFRPKPYGIEYRTPSNVWLQDDSIMEWVIHATIYACDRANGRLGRNYGKELGSRIKAINEAVASANAAYIRELLKGVLGVKMYPPGVK